ncbi:MAG: hypothetical protein M3291_01885 [Actinomycetota bacterium]|nr:hypothetical protein [Actinomycetota bacterium]
MRASVDPPAAPPSQASRREFGSALLLVAVIALAGETAIFPVYSPDGPARLVLLALAALAGVLLGGARCRPPTWAIVVSALLTVRALATAPPLATVVSDPRLLTGVVVIGAASAVPALLPLVRVAHAGQVVAGTLATAAAGYGLVVAGSRAPGGDTRWAGLALLLAAATLVARQVWARGGARLGLAVFAVLVPGTSRVVQQSWTEPLLLVLLVVGAILVDRGRLVWAAVAFGSALVAQPYAVVLAPLLLLWPPARRWQHRVRSLAVAVSAAAAVTLLFPASLSLWLHVPMPAQPPLLALGLVTGYLLAWRCCCPRTGSGFLLASAVVFTTVGLVGKQTFFGQWWLIAALVVAGLAMAGGPRPTSRQGMGF